MDQILVDVFLPALSRKYDFWLPKKMKVGDVLPMICGDISNIENNPELFPDLSGILLCSYFTGKSLPRSATLEGAGVKSGDKLAVL